MKASRQIASAGQALARREVVAQDAKDDLRDQLFADRDFTAAGKPELHGGNIISGWLPGEKDVKAMSRNHCRFSGCGSMMKRMNFSETIFLFFLALIIFGPKKLPEIARQIGKYMNEFRRASNEFKAQIEQEIAHLEVEKQSDSSAEPSAGRHCQSYVELCAQLRSGQFRVPIPMFPQRWQPPRRMSLYLPARTVRAATDAIPATEAAAHPKM